MGQGRLLPRQLSLEKRADNGAFIHQTPIAIGQHAVVLSLGTAGL